MRQVIYQIIIINSNIISFFLLRIRAQSTPRKAKQQGHDSPWSRGPAVAGMEAESATWTIPNGLGLPTGSLIRWKWSTCPCSKDSLRHSLPHCLIIRSKRAPESVMTFFSPPSTAKRIIFLPAPVMYSLLIFDKAIEDTGIGSIKA